MKFPFLQVINNVGYLTEKQDNFSSLYLKVRGSEKRVLNDNQVQKLPFVPADHPHYKEWLLRQKSAKRFIDHLKKKKKPLQILDIGCGNGWFTNQMAATSENHSVVGLDINSLELEQAARIFKGGNLHFVYGDIFSLKSLFSHQFDIITINATIQYFRNFGKLISLLKLSLKPRGELHIMDSPFYRDHEIDAAKNRTIQYYTNLGFPQMAEHYFHHSMAEIKEFEIRYRPGRSLLQRFVGRKDSPFMWLKYVGN